MLLHMQAVLNIQAILKRSKKLCRGKCFICLITRRQLACQGRQNQR